MIPNLLLPKSEKSINIYYSKLSYVKKLILFGNYFRYL